MITFLIWLDGRWGSRKTAAVIVALVLASLSAGVFLLGPGVTMALAGLLEGASYIWFNSRRSEPLPPLSAETPKPKATPLVKAGPQIAIACLILIILAAGLFVADAYTSCKQAHGQNYNCMPSGQRLVR